MYGLALEGGGAKGAYQAGALKAIEECGFEIGAIVGTSIGSFNGAMFAQGDFEKLYDFSLARINYILPSFTFFVNTYSWIFLNFY